MRHRVLRRLILVYTVCSSLFVQIHTVNTVSLRTQNNKPQIGNIFFLFLSEIGYSGFDLSNRLLRTQLAWNGKHFLSWKNKKTSQTVLWIYFYPVCKISIALFGKPLIGIRQKSVLKMVPDIGIDEFIDLSELYGSDEQRALHAGRKLIASLNDPGIWPKTQSRKIS